ncbi:metapyrocatechase (plasmid) [Burkholderia sp. PAMC 28687]|uniref:VOC family protein n=1 Tax=Burkholderia sp. PAMC 28687 TaxID=1795874 RepID=UPI0007839830|nr:VOC family protein [Burkholderia sp. PAMC 28687]AMM18547.1 metapyrocatechase [Burkholderia sp. PAMC 28687]
MKIENGSPHPAVHSIHEFVFGVPDLGEAENFFRSFGLDVRRKLSGLSLYTFGHEHRWGRVLEGERKRLLWLTLGVFAHDREAFEERLTLMNIARIAPPHGASTEGIWIVDPQGIPLQLIVAEKTSPQVKSARIFPPESSESGRAPCRSEVTQVKPNRLSHILLFTSDVDQSRRFYSDVQGLRLSDHSGSIIAFMHGPHGSDHHLIAFAKSDGPGLHHTSWDVSSIDDVALGSEQMARAGYCQGWGLGRHVLGSNYFRYVRDPWGSYAEYSFDIDFIPAGVDWPAADYLPEDSLYVWGPPVPDDFVTNFEGDSE